METQKAYVSPENTAVVKCPHCRTVKTVNVLEKYRNLRAPLKIRCTCGSAFGVLFEVRKAYRKETNLQGYYTRLPAAEDPEKMVVTDISLTGMGFTTLAMHNLSIGDRLGLEFTLDDARGSEIEKEVIVKFIKDKVIGCEFTESIQYDKILGFYLMS